MTANDDMKKEIQIKELEDLRKIELPTGWEIARLDVEFVKTNVEYPIDRQRVLYDYQNNTFYLRLPKDCIYKKAAEGVIEGIEIMNKANKIIKSK